MGSVMQLSVEIILNLMLSCHQYIIVSRSRILQWSPFILCSGGARSFAIAQAQN